VNGSRRSRGSWNHSVLAAAPLPPALAARQSMHVAVEPRIDILFAAESPQALILRRGPSDWVHVLTWDTSTDVVTRGAWFHGRIDASRCSLSPDGQLLIYFAVCHRKTSRWPLGFAWTAISKPPWLTALVRWTQSDTWAGGGSFCGNSSVLLNFSKWRHWVLRRGHIPKTFTVFFAPKSSSNSSATLPAKCSYDNAVGFDQQGLGFALQNTCLVRQAGDKIVKIVDFSNMSPDPQPSPQSARVW
jgi:hypothetical protein